MPIKNLQRSFRRLGKIRIGDQQPVMKDGKQLRNNDGTLKFRPSKLEVFRLTSPNRELLEAAAQVYGGDITEWEGAPGEEDEWQLYTTAKVLDIVLPPVSIDEEGDVESASFSQWFESWSKGGCTRRCDGERETISGQPCSSMNPLCPTDPDARSAAAANGKACKMTTRLLVILPQVPDLGVWMLESHGWYAAVELGGFMDFLARRAPGQFVNARLRLEARSVKRKGQTRNFAVPVIELPQAMAGELLAAAPVQAIGSGKATGVVTDAERVRSFVISCSDAGWDDDVRHAIVAYATKGRTRSSREVAVDEWPVVDSVARWFSEGKLVRSGTGELTVLAKPGQPPTPAPAPRPIPVQSREAPPAVENPADEWDREALMARLEKLDDEHREIAGLRWVEQGIAPPNSDRLTKDDVERAESLLLGVEKDADEAYKNRLRVARGRMAEVGVTTDAGRAEVVKEATAGAGDIKRLSAADLAAIDAYCQRLADSEAEAAAS